jgi:hypothetical protein
VPLYVENAVHDYEEACEAHFCNAVSATFDATVCEAGDGHDHSGDAAYEWAGSFPGTGTMWTWRAQKVGGAYADPTMTLVILDAADTSLETLQGLDGQADTLFDGTCTAVFGSADPTSAPLTAGACYTLTFDDTASETTFTVASSTGAVAFFAQHYPTEFEETMHYLQDASGADVEPVAELPVPAAHEWAGIFAYSGMPYTWRAQKVGGSYADPTMDILVLAAPEATEAALADTGAAAATAFEADCMTLYAGDTITPGACYTLEFDQSATETTYLIDAGSAAAISIYAQHVPTEFEETMHYLQDSYGADVEPMAEEAAGGGHDHGHDHGAGGASCGCESQEADHPFAIDCTDTVTIRAAGVTLASCGGGVPSSAVCEDAVPTDPTCQIAFFVIQAHHDHCPHDTLTTAEENLFHDWEAYCIGCAVARQYDPTLAACPAVDCTNTTAAEVALETVLLVSCIPGVSCCNTVTEQAAFHLMMSYHDQCEHDQVPIEVENAVHDYEVQCEAHFCNAVSATFDPTVCEADVVAPPAAVTCGTGTALSASNHCEITCERRLEEQEASVVANPQRIVQDFLAKNPAFAAKMDDEMRTKLNELTEETLFGQPALA